jgi:hypothetical protein
VTDKPFYAPDYRYPDPTPTPGFKLWTITDGKRALACELRDDERLGAGVDVQLLEDGEILVSRRCITGDAARYVAQSFKTDHLRQGWSELTDPPDGEESK